MTADEMNALIESAPKTDARYFAWVPMSKDAYEKVTTLFPNGVVLGTDATGLVIPLDGPLMDGVDVFAERLSARVHGIFEREYGWRFYSSTELDDERYRDLLRAVDDMVAARKVLDAFEVA
jgi:hypothetical protein